MTYKKRVLVCTFVALTSGLFTAFISGKMSMATRTSTCKTQLWGLNTVCQAVAAPAAFSGATTGLWTGTILGAFIAGLATRKPNQ